MTRKTLPIAVLLILLQGVNLWAQLDVGIVLPFENNTRDPNLEWISEGFVESLTSNLASPRVLMLGRRERAAAFDTLGIPHANILSLATVYTVAKELDATRVIIGSYEYKDGALVADAQLLEMDGPRVAEKFTESGALKDLMELQTGLAWQIQSYLRPNLTLSKIEYIKEQKGPRLEAFENYIRGLLSTERAPQIRYLREAQRLDARYTKPAFDLGMIYFQDEDYPTSVPWLSKLQRGDEDYLEANYFLGLAYLKLGQYERSAAALRVIAQRLPLNEVQNNLGIALSRQERPGAVQYFEKAVQNEPEDPDYQFNLGYTYWKQGRYEEALGPLKNALQLQRRPLWWTVYIQSLEKANQTAESAQQKQLFQQQFSGWVAPPNLDNLERPKDDYDGVSLHQLLMLVQIQTEQKHQKLTLEEHVALHYQRAQELEKEGFEREAIDELQLAIEYDPDDAPSYQELARLYLKSDRYEEASKSLSRSLQREENADSYLLLAKVYLEQGKLAEAEAQLNAALRLKPYSTEAATLREEINARTPASQDSRR